MATSKSIPSRPGQSVGNVSTPAPASITSSQLSPSALDSQCRRDRKKAGLVALPSPWAWLRMKGAQEVLIKAYKLATWNARHHPDDEPGLSDQQRREMFAQELADTFRDALFAHAVDHAQCWPVTPETPHHQNYPAVWQALQEDLDASWRPEYPQFGKPVPEATKEAPEALPEASKQGAGGSVHPWRLW